MGLSSKRKRILPLSASYTTQFKDVTLGMGWGSEQALSIFQSSASRAKSISKQMLGLCSDDCSGLPLQKQNLDGITEKNIILSVIIYFIQQLKKMFAVNTKATQHTIFQNNNHYINPPELESKVRGSLAVTRKKFFSRVQHEIT